MLILNSLENGLGCNCVVRRLLILIYHRFLKEICSLKMGMVYHLWYKATIGSYHFRYVKKTIEQMYQNMRLLICKLIVMTF